MATAGPQITAKLSLDGKPFEEGLKKALTAAERYERQMERARYRVIYKQQAQEVKLAEAHAAKMAKIRATMFAPLKWAGRGAAMQVGAGISNMFGRAAESIPKSIQNAYEWGRSMMNLSRATGFTAKNTALWAQALEDSQIQVPEVIMSIKMMDQLYLKAAHGVNSANTAFAQLGINYKELIHLAPEDAFNKVGTALAAIENPALRSAGAIQVFGRNGAKMLKLFERGGALDMAREALGGSSGIIGKDGGAFEKIALRLSHIGVKIRSMFVGVAQAIMPMMEKFTDIFHKMDFTGWGTKLGAAINDALAWIVAFWNDPEKVTKYFWEYAKYEAGELEGILIGAAEKFGIALVKAVQSAIDATTGGLLGNAYEGVAQIVDTINYGADKLFGTGYEPLSKHNQPQSSATPRERLAKMRPTAAFEAAKASLGQNTTPRMGVDTQETIWRLQGMQHNVGVGAFHSSLQGASMAGALGMFSAFNKMGRGEALRRGMSISGMHAGAYDQSDILHHGERRNFRNAAIAARSGRMLAAGLDPSMLGKGEVFNPDTMRRPGESANGDKQRAKAFAREVARKEAGQGTDNQLLGDISRNTAGSLKVMEEAFQ